MVLLLRAWLSRISSLTRLHTGIPTMQGIPLVIENDGRLQRVYDIYSRLLKDRIIDDHFASAIIAQLLFLQSESTKSAIHMYINSPGGSVTAGLGIYDTMQYVSAPIATWCIGQASSMGSLLLAAGTPGMRNALPSSRIMVHQPSGSAQGAASDILIRAEEIQRLRSLLNDIYVRHTHQPLSVIEAALDRDRYMSAHEARAFGLIDTVVQKR